MTAPGAFWWPALGRVRAARAAGQGCAQSGVAGLVLGVLLARAVLLPCRWPALGRVRAAVRLIQPGALPGVAVRCCRAGAFCYQ